MEFANSKDPKKSTSNAVVTVRSNVWPGAFSFYFNSQVYQIYIGNGHKFENNVNLYPCHPPKLMPDVAEFEDQPEPNPLKEPVVEQKPEGEEGEEQEEQEEEDNWLLF